MKFCAIICEFNPFHNGHKYLIEQARKNSGCDKILCIMSGSFTQRGDMCILDKHVRARHAILGGADCVIELPAEFSVAPAEVFAKGAVEILSRIDGVTTLAFGHESGDAEKFHTAARLVIDENDNFKNRLRKGLDLGESYVKSYTSAFAAAGGFPEFLEKPNNILGLEYTKAIISQNANIKILPVKRIQSQYNDEILTGAISSAKAIRSNLLSSEIKNSLPDYVYADLKDDTAARTHYENSLLYALHTAEAENLKNIYGCSEGLENRLKKYAYLPFDEFINKTTTKRYSSARIKRILCANLLGLKSNAPIGERGINVLAVKSDCADEILPLLSIGNNKLIDGSYALWRFLNNLPEKQEYIAKV